MTRLKLTDMLNHKNPRMNDYGELSRKQGTRGTEFGTTFANQWRMPLLDEIMAEVFPNIRKRLTTAVKDGILLDVGCGDRESRYSMLSVAKAFGAAQYIGLDQGEIDGSHPLQQSDVRFEREAFAPVEVYYHQEDMLSFLARLQTGISTIAINGIDYHVIPDGNYHHALAREIARVLRPGGIAMGIRAMVGYYLEEFGLREMPSITPMEFDRGFHGENFFLEKTGGSR